MTLMMMMMTEFVTEATGDLLQLLPFSSCTCQQTGDICTKANKKSRTLLLSLTLERYHKQRDAQNRD